MDTLTVRRWVAAPPRAVWPRVMDLEAMVADDPELDLESFDLVGTGPTPGRGSVATITHRHGRRVRRLVLTVEDRDLGGQHVLFTVTDGGERWLVDVSVTTLAGGFGSSDVTLRARRDETTTSHAPGGNRRAAREVALLLDAFARSLDDLDRVAVDAPAPEAVPV